MWRNLKKIFKFVDIDIERFVQKVAKLSISHAVRENNFFELIERLRQIVPDISQQELTVTSGFNDYWELKRRALQAFQCAIMLQALEYFPPGKLTVVDIGDSAGAHMKYLKELTKGKFEIDAISVNLNDKEIERIKAEGGKAILCRAEELDLKGMNVDLGTSFQMVEHLHNPSIFFRRLAKKTSCNRMVVTLPYVKHSRVGLQPMRNKIVSAEEVHIFELSPKDWTLLIHHSGWKVIHSKIYYQYPKRLPIASQVFSWYWRSTDFEGFWGAILEKDTTLSDRYQDWED